MKKLLFIPLFIFIINCNNNRISQNTESEVSTLENQFISNQLANILYNYISFDDSCIYALYIDKRLPDDYVVALIKYPKPSKYRFEIEYKSMKGQNFNSNLSIDTITNQAFSLFEQLYILCRKPLNYISIKNKNIFIFSGIEDLLKQKNDTLKFLLEYTSIKGGCNPWSIFLKKDSSFLLEYSDIAFFVITKVYEVSVAPLDSFIKHIYTLKNLPQIKSTGVFALSTNLYKIIASFIKENLIKDGIIELKVQKTNYQNHEITIDLRKDEPDYLLKKHPVNISFINGHPVYIYTGIENFIEVGIDKIYNYTPQEQPIASWKIVISPKVSSP